MSDTYLRSSSGLTVINSAGKAFITTSYSSGIMSGDIKGAFLSDTSTASVTGTELITNGTFAGNLNGWTLAGDTTPTYDSGSGGAKITSGAAIDGTITQTITSTTGVIVTFNITARTSGFIGLSLNGSLVLDGLTALQTHTYYPDNAITSISLIHRGGGGGYAIVDNVSVRTEELDRSVNNKGLAVYGTITKTPVATGANLVGYSGFSASNYLQQPQNTALDFGTGDFSIMFWGIMVPLGGTYIAFQINHVAGSTNLYMDGIGLAITVGGNNKLYQNTSSNNIGWSHQTIVRRSGVLYYYSNGKLITSTGSTESLVTNASSTLKIGEGFNQSLALFRISATAPSPEQILKIYNDEKVLFQPGAQATLYGASDAVTALAYDDTTDLLSVGTSSGRSDFSGLKRINNTTTAVTTAISASNGLIAEQ